MPTRRITNTTETSRLIPDHHLEAGPGETVRIPVDAPLPGGFAEADKTSVAPRTAKQADAQGAELGIEFPAGSKLKDKQELIAARRAELAAG